MVWRLKYYWLDFGFVAALLLIAAVPLLCLRGQEFLDQIEFFVGLPVLLVGMVVLWTALVPRCTYESPPSTTLVSRPQTAEDRFAWWQIVGIAVLLAAVTFVGFYRPLRLHFWGGADDFTNFPAMPFFTWLAQWDYCINRPLTALPILLGQQLKPMGIEGFLWVGAGLCWFNSLLLFSLVRLIVPRARVLPLAAAVLLITDRSEPSRFLVMWTSNYYWSALAWLLVSFWLFLWSYRRSSRPLLFLSCLALGASLLTNEAAYPLALLGPVFAWLLKEPRRQLPVWTCAWMGTLALFASRLLLFLANRGANAYQIQQSGEAFQNPQLLWNTLCLHLGTGWGHFQVSGAIGQHWKQALIVLALVILLGCLVGWRGAHDTRPQRRYYAIVLPMAMLVLLLGSVPFLHMNFIFRTQFFAAPGLVLLIACVLCLITSFLGRRLGAAVAVSVLGLLTANATAETITQQQNQRANSPVNFERMVHIFRQIHGVCPNPTPDTLMLLYLDEPHYAPFLCNLSCVGTSQRVLGAVAIQANYIGDPFPSAPVFQENGILVTKAEHFGLAPYYPYEKVLIFRIARDSTVTLMRQLSPVLQSQDQLVARYQPLPLLRPGPVKEMDYLRFPRWISRPPDLFDMTDGVLLGQGWELLEIHEGRLSRRATEGAELVINPLGQSQRRFCLQMDGTKSGRLEALDLEGNVVATSLWNKSGEAQLTIPTNPNRATLIRLRVVDGTETEKQFRVYCSGDQLADYQRPIGLLPDIVTANLSLGVNWFPLETVNRHSYRWVRNDAEIMLEQASGTSQELCLDVEPGPSMEGEPCQLALQDQTGKTLASACIRHRETLLWKLPSDARAGTILLTRDRRRPEIVL